MATDGSTNVFEELTRTHHEDGINTNYQEYAPKRADFEEEVKQ